MNHHPNPFDLLSDVALCSMHRIYEVNAAKMKDDPSLLAWRIRIKAAVSYHLLEQRVPVKHLWEIEKTLMDLNLKLQ